MSELAKTRKKIMPAEAFPPGDFIREELDARGWTQEDLAKILGKPLPTVNQIIRGKRGIIANTAKRLGAAFGTSAEFWMNLEAAWQLHQDCSPTPLTEVQSRAELFSLLPIREMQKRGWLRAASTDAEREAEVKRFFEIDDMTQLKDLPAAARSSVRAQGGGLTPAQYAWCVRALQVARLVDAKRYSRSALQSCVEQLRALAGEPEEARQVPKVLASIGIRFVLVEHLSGTRMDGAALWLTNTKPVIAMSLRYGRIDYFWFTLLHELAHIFNCDGQVADIDVEFESTEANDEETRANKAAATWLIDQEKLDSFILRTTPLYSSRKITNFAKRVGVHAGIVVGQLKHRGELEWKQHSRLQNVDVRTILQHVAMCDGWGQTPPVDNGLEA